MKKFNIAVVGATGMVGNKFLEVLTERQLPVENYYLFASARSAGKQIDFMGKPHTVIELTEENVMALKGKVDFALFSAGAGTSAKFAPVFVEAGAVVVDNSSQWRMYDDVPLVVPEVNPEDVKWNKGIIANPNSYPIAFNMLPHIDVFLDNGYTKEEWKMIEETKKILHDQSLKITATTVRVPVYHGHSESINIEFKKPCTRDEVFDCLSHFPGLVLMDDVKNNVYPMPILAEDHDEVFVGRVRIDESVESGVNIWCVADNIRKGAATNAVQIVQLLINNALEA